MCRHDNLELFEAFCLESLQVIKFCGFCQIQIETKPKEGISVCIETFSSLSVSSVF